MARWRRRRGGTALAIVCDLAVMGFGADLLVQRQWFGGTALAFLGIALFVGEVLALAARRRPALRLTTLYALLFFPMIGL